MMKNNEYLDLAEQFKSIAHPDRVAILKLLCHAALQRMTVKSIYEKLEMAQPVVSRHLSIMRKSGLLKREQEGNTTCYGLCMERRSVNSLMKGLKEVF